MPGPRRVRFAPALLALALACSPAVTERAPGVDPEVDAGPSRPSRGQPDAGAPASDAGAMGAGGRDAAPAPGGRDGGGTAVAPDGAAPSSPDAGGTRAPSPVNLPAPGAAGPLPVVFIETGGKSIPGTRSAMIPATIKIVQDHDGNFDWRDPKPLLARPIAFQTTIGIDRHGNASDQFVEMKAYNVEFRDDKGEDQSHAVLGMGKGSDWLLFACYIDKTCMKNMLAYTLFRELGGWASRGRFVEVVLDGRYNGLYVFFEKIRRDNDRLNIPKLAPDAPDLTGGYIYKCDSPSDGAAHDWKTPGGYTLSYVYPKYNKITDAQKKYLRTVTGDLDRLLASATWADPQRGYRAMIDVKSWVDYFLINELSNNADGLLRSAFFHKQPASLGGKIHAGPPWDYDLAFSTDLREHDRTDVWQYQHAPAKIGSDPTHVNNVKIFEVWKKLMSDPAFQRDLKYRWNAVGETTLGAAAINQKIDGWAKDLTPATKRHHARWPIIGRQIFGNSHFIGKTWQEDVEHLKSWIARRLVWLDRNMSGTCPAP